MAVKVKCEVCGTECHSIQIHLRDMHSEGSAAPITIEEYQSRWPDSELLSDVAKQRLAERRAKQVTTEVTKAPETTGPKVAMAELFNLGSIKEAQTSTGKDIMIDVCQDEGFEELIPDRDPNYIFPVDILKSLLMAVSQNIPCYAYGHAGVGKSTIFEQICAATKRRFLRVQHTQNTEESHIVGQWVVRKHKDEETGQVVTLTVFEPGPLVLAMRYGWTYCADEYDRAHPSVLSVYQAVLEGKPLLIKEADAANRLIRPHENFRIVATGNTNGSGDETGLYQATIIQDAATFERFGVVVKMDYMPTKQETALVRAQTKLSESDSGKIVDFCQRIREAFPSQISLSIGPRVAINIGRIGLLRGDFKKGIELAFTNRLPESEREAANSIAQRIFG